MNINVINKNKYGETIDIKNHFVPKTSETEAFYNLIAAHEVKVQREKGQEATA